MCYADGSLGLAVNVCPMCKVFPHARCPHVRELCRNRALHPRMDVLFMKNAEVDAFNGCGFCKWARINPPSKQAGYNNIGWPGCCRPPSSNEYRLIHPADWRSVSIVHNIPVPHHIKATLEGLSVKASPVVTFNKTPERAKAGGLLVSPNPRTTRGHSPQNALSRNLSPGATSSATSSSVPTPSCIENNLGGSRWQRLTENRIEGVRSAQSSPHRKHLDLEASSAISALISTPRRASTVRRSTPTQFKVPSTQTNGTDGLSPHRQPSVRRRASVSNATPPPRAASASPHPPFLPTPIISAKSPVSKDAETLSCASGSGSDGMGSISDSTVTSDGAFTDYLSDESEAELQRQAEAKAALVAQNQAEELEFKAARQQLAHVDLQPPKSWNVETHAKPRQTKIMEVRPAKNWTPTNITNSTATRSGSSFPATHALYASNTVSQSSQTQG